MPRLLRCGFVILVLVIGSGFIFKNDVSAYSSPGAPNGYVNDFAHVLTEDQIKALSTTVHTYKEQTTHQIALVTIPTTKEESIEQYAVQLFQEWGIGQKERDNGVLVLAAIQDHKIRIEVGYGLEPLLTDTKSAQIIAHAKPLLKAEKYAEAFQEITQEVMTTIDTGEPSFFLTETETNQGFLESWGGQYLIALIVVSMLLLFLIPVAWVIINGLRLNRRGEGWGPSSDSSDSSTSSSTDSSSSSSSSSDSTNSFGGGSSGGGGASGSW